MSPRVANIVLVAVLAALAFLLCYRMAEAGITWDEGGDLGITECIQNNSPFDCRDDISQTRLPFLMHSMLGPAWEDEHRPHYELSAVFSLLTLLVVYSYARHAYGTGAATLTALLYVTSIPLLASGRMLLTHSNIIFTFFTTSSLVCMLRFARGEGRAWLVLCGVLSGAAAASHPIAVFNGLAILGIYLAARRWAWRDLMYFPIAAATFFAASLIYVKPENLRALIETCAHPSLFPEWNYFGTGSAVAPWWFPALVFVVKTGPWWLVLAAACAFRARLERTLVVFLIAFGVNLILKGAVFHYEAPHHQVQWYPLLLMVLAVAIVKARGRMILAGLTICLTIQLYDVVRFFPHYLFYSSQYGPRFVGELYGPAVMHAQGRGPLLLQIDRILREEPYALILVADNNILEWKNPRVVPFSRRDPNARYEYAFVDRLYGEHFRFPERDAYNSLLAERYRPYWTYYFPPHMWVYRILRMR